MLAIKNTETGNIVIVSQAPQWINGMWECGDSRFTDSDGAIYSPIIYGSKVSPVQFKLLFAPAERVAIAVAKAADPVLQDFFSIVDDPRLTFVDLGLQSTKDAVAYLVGKKLITQARSVEILDGVVK